MPRRATFLVAAALIAGAAACADDDDTTVATIVSDAPPGDWQQLVDDVAASSPGVPGVALAVLGDDVDVAVAAGSGGPDRDDPLTPDRPFRIASNTKTYTAAAVLRLVEDGTIRLDQPISELVDPALLALLTDDGYDPAAITVTHLLQHTSGLYDYASDVDFQTMVLGDPDRHWTRADQVRLAMENGEPLGEPGTAFASSDTGYVLLGDILERATGSTLAEAYRDLLGFDGLDVTSTWLEDIEPDPDGVAPMASQFFETQDMVDADPSFDLYGGGGLVSTVGDLATFYDALLDGELFEDEATLRTMTDVPAVSGDAGAAMGLFRFEHPDLGTCWSHSGFWGTFVAACPDVTVAISCVPSQPRSTVRRNRAPRPSRSSRHLIEPRITPEITQRWHSR